jgi:hypothetical protein
MKRFILGILTVFCVTSVANAATFTFDGNIANHNDVIQIGFTLDNDTTNVRVWTDSFMGSTNFDPITALWDATDGSLIFQNDDNSSIALGQTSYDSGFDLPSLSAGKYLFTVATYSNFAVGSTISEGFSYDDETPIALSDWCQPANQCDMGTYWRVHLDGVDTAVNPVPLPAALWLFGFGLLGMFGITHRKTNG